MQHVEIKNLPTSNSATPVFAGMKFQTPWETLDYLELGPGASFSPPPHTSFEQGYIVIEGTVDYSGNGHGQQLRGPALLLCQLDGHPNHTLTNNTAQTVRLLHVRVALAPHPDQQRPLRQ